MGSNYSSLILTLYRYAGYADGEREVEMNILKQIPICVSRQNVNFDEACNEARIQALTILGCDEDGNLSNCPEWNISSDSISIIFVSINMSCKMHGWEYEYLFECRLISGV